MTNIFKVDASIGVSKFRISLLRIFYVIIVLLLGIEVWTKLIMHNGPWQPLPAVAYSFWATFSALSILGFFHPIKMIPLLLVQCFYKLIWLIIVAYPLWTENELLNSDSYGLAKANLIGFGIDILIIPWPYVFKNYILIKKRSVAD